jgi:hypothetical protein
MRESIAGGQGIRSDTDHLLVSDLCANESLFGLIKQRIFSRKSENENILCLTLSRFDLRVQCLAIEENSGSLPLYYRDVTLFLSSCVSPLPLTFVHVHRVFLIITATKSLS